MAQNTGFVDITCRNLMVTFLPSDMTEIELRELFQQYGPVDSARIITNKQTMTSAGYGFVVMSTDEDAEAAIQALEGYNIRHKRLRVALAQPDAASRTNVYVAGLPKTFSENDLTQLFAKFGDISEVKILRDPQEQTRGAGFVRFAKRSMAAAAIEKMAGQMVVGHDRPLTVRFANPKRWDKPLAGGPIRAYPRTGQMDLGQQAMTTPYNLLARGGGVYGQAQQAIGPGGPLDMKFGMGGGVGGNFNNTQSNLMGGPRFNNFIGQGQGQAGSLAESYVLFVYNIAPTIDANTLGSLFIPFGTVLRANVKEGKGYGFVTMANQMQAQSAIDLLNGLAIQGRALQVSFKR